MAIDRRLLRNENRSLNFVQRFYFWQLSLIFCTGAPFRRCCVVVLFWETGKVLRASRPVVVEWLSCRKSLYLPINRTAVTARCTRVILCAAEVGVVQPAVSFTATGDPDVDSVVRPGPKRLIRGTHASGCVQLWDSRSISRRKNRGRRGGEIDRAKGFFSTGHGLSSILVASRHVIINSNK